MKVLVVLFAMAALLLFGAVMVVSDGSLQNYVAYFNSSNGTVGDTNLQWNFSTQVFSLNGSLLVNESEVCTSANGLCGSGGGNASWNQSYADTLYYPLSSNPSGYLTAIVEDTTPQLGGELDAQGNNLVDVADITFRTGASGGTIRTGTSAADKWQLQAYDVNDGVYRKVAEADAGNEPTFEVIAPYFQIWDGADETKHVMFNLSMLSTSTDRMYAFPDASGTLALTSDFSPGGSDTQVQFNDGGAFNGSASLTYEKSATTLSLGVLGGTEEPILVLHKGGSVTGKVQFSSGGSEVGRVESDAGEDLTLTTFGSTARDVVIKPNNKIMAVFDPDNEIRFTGDGSNVIATFSDVGDEVLLLTPDTSTDIGLTVQGAAAQSANLQEWQNSAGTALSVVDNAGYLGIGTSDPQKLLHLNGSAGSGMRVQGPNYYLDISAADAGTGNVGFRTTAPFIGFYDNSGNIVQSYTTNADGNGLTRTGNYRGVYVTNNIGIAGYPTMIVRQGTGQTANQLQIQNTTSGNIFAFNVNTKNMTLTSPDGSAWNCGVSNAGAFSCS